MMIQWTDNAWEDYLHWQQYDKTRLKRINRLIKEIKRHPFEGLGEPEPLKHNLQGCWSRRIDREHRIVYQVTQDVITVIQCRFHY